MFGYLNLRNNKIKTLVAVTTGKLIPIEEVNDEAFSSKALGDGLAIIPEVDYVVSPCSGEITMLFPTLHSFGIKSDDGLNILIHIGVDTVALKGKGFKSFVKLGDRVKKAQKIISFDTVKMVNDKVDMTVMTVFPNCHMKLDIEKSGNVRSGKSIIVTYE